MLTRIASIHFAPVAANRSIYGGFYNIPAVPLNAEPAIIEIEDRAQHDEGPFMLGEGGTKRIKIQYEVLGEVIAADILSEWTQSGYGMGEGCRPGIWIVRDKVALMKELVLENGDKIQVNQLDVMGRAKYRPAAEMERAAMWAEDIERARAEDKAYAEYCFIKGNSIAAEKNGALIQFMPKNYKLAAQQYGFEATWALKDATKYMQSCPLCSTTIMKGVVICPKCMNVVDIEAYADFEARKASAKLAREERILDEATRPKPHRAIGIRREEPAAANI